MNKRPRTRSKSSSTRSKRVSRNSPATRAALIEAARREFEEAGFDATHSNKIAQRAGYAPQTFYRHFTDKLEIFLAVYREWVADEQRALESAKTPRKIAETLLRHHKRSRIFRRALRQLSLSDDRVRAARAESRLAQIEVIRARYPHLSRTPQEELMRRLLIIERLADACAEGEFTDMGLPPKTALEQLVAAVNREMVGPSS